MHKNRALITGANRGIGLEFVRQCLHRGDQVFAGCRNPAAATELLRLQSDYPDALSVLQLDVTDECSIGASFEAVQREAEGLDVLISNAAYTSNLFETIDELKADIVLKHFHTNALGPMLVIQRYLKLLRKGVSPKIAVVSSEAGSFQQKYNDHLKGYSYRGSKAALNMFVLILTTQIKREGIPVVALHPGWVRSHPRNKNAPLSPAESVGGMLEIIDGLELAKSGGFFQYDGKELPW